MSSPTADLVARSTTTSRAATAPARRPPTQQTHQPDRVSQVVLGAVLLLMHFRQYPLAKEVLILLSLASVGLLVASGSRVLVGGRVPVPVVLFVGWASASIAWTADPRGTAVALVAMLMAAAAAVSFGMLLSPAQISTVVVGVVKLIIAVTALSLVVANDWATAPLASDGAPGWHGPFSHKNGLGAFLVLAVPALLVLPARRRWLWLLLAAGLLVGSQSSTALAIVLLSVAVVAWRYGVRSFRTAAGRTAFTTWSALVGAMAVLVMVMAPDLVARALGRNLTLTGRTEIWEAVQRQIALRPLHGWGWGGVWRPTSAPTLEMWREARFQAFYAHNGYLDVLLQVGAIGFAFLALTVLATLVRQLRDASCDLSVWGALVLATACLAAISESGPFIDSPGLFLIFLLATVSVQSRHTSPRRP